MDSTRDPYDYLMNAASDKSTWMLIAGPAALLIIVVIVYAFLVAAKRRREAKELREAMEESETQKPLTMLKGTDQSIAMPLPDEAEAEPEPVLPLAKEPPPKLAIAVEAEPAPRPSAPVEVTEVDEVRQTDRASWLGRLKKGLSKTRDALRGSLESLFTGQTKIDQGTLERLHELLYRADIGVATADKLVQAVKTKLGKDEVANWEAVSACLKEEARTILTKNQASVVLPATGPFVVLIVGVNGVGKTTTIGKLGAHFLAEDKTVLLAAGDTFRAAAIEQLEVWGQRLGVDVVRHKQGSDPAAVAYDGVKAAMSREMDILLIDTAGRLHNKNELMAELAKINRVIGKDLPGAPHATWLVIDATTGQNAVMQVKAFKEVVGLTGLVVTKLDGTAKGGVIIGIADQFNLPILYVGVGEKAADLRAFNVDDYVDSLF